jgi:hypothetical protein
MKRESVKMALGFLALALTLAAPRPFRAADAKDPCPSMASLDQYLIADPAAEIALARTAAPPSISQDVTVVVLGRMAIRLRSKARTVYLRCGTRMDEPHCG